MHKRRQILEHYRAALLALPGIKNVWITRADAPLRNAYPSFSIFDVEESVETLTIHAMPREQMRTLTIGITGWGLYSADAELMESNMDAIAVLIESAMLNKPPGVDDVRLSSSDKLLSLDEPKYSAITLRYNLIYRTTEGAATV